MQYLLMHNERMETIVNKGGISDLFFANGWRVACSGKRITQTQIEWLRSMGYAEAYEFKDNVA